MDLPSIDLNLLVALHALLRERNVTRAGESIGLSQPAMSASLGRLRRHFDDELLTRNGQRYDLTPLAAALVDQADVALHQVRRTFAGRPVFDPATSTREFLIGMTDYALTVLGDPLLRLLEARAPDVQLSIRPSDRLPVAEAHVTLRDYDFLVLPRGCLNDLPSADLFRDRWVCVVDTANFLVGDELTDDDVGQLRWVRTVDAPTQHAAADNHRPLMGVDRRVDAVIESNLALPFLLAGTQRAAMLQHRMAAKLAGAGGLRILELPSAPPQLVQGLWWHPSREGDPGHRWLQQLLVEAAATLAPFDLAADDLSGEPAPL